ncbi:MAG: NFACT family protein [Oscillospiraceae bacterium]|nr:NFACT family protein [Oscillospiraceae bacterium]
MAFDAVFLTAVADELRETILDTRIDKVQQPDRFTVLLSVRSRDYNGKLLLSLSPSAARVHLTETAPENPAQPSMFCMLLRKHLTGSRITNIEQPPMERLLDFTLDGTNEFGEPCRRHLIAELMGRGANLILCGEDGRIIDCLRRIELDPAQKRPVLPGLYYLLPPLPERYDPAQADAAQLRRLLEKAEGPLAAWLQRTFGGLSPMICREIALFAGGDIDALAEPAQAEKIGAWFSLIRERRFSPMLLCEGRTPKAFAYCEIFQYGDYLTQRRCGSFSELLDAFYASRDREDRMRTRTQALHKTVSTLLKRTERKLQNQREELASAVDREHLRRMGDLLKANLHTLSRGQKTARVVDFYDPELREVTVPLSELLSPQQNAEKYYKEYAKAKTAEKVLTEQIAHGEAECAYFEAVLEELQRAETEKDVAEIRQELAESGYVRDTEKKKMKSAPSRPMAFRAADGTPILVGRNNRQNDLLTLKTAAKNDLWLHVQKQPGSHVIIDCSEGEPTDATVTEAAMLAAWFSSAKNGQNVAVDVTNARYVKKPTGARPGMVIYDRYRTVFVTPDAETVEKLRT